MKEKKYKVLKNDIFGRFMAADRNLKAGEVILTEKPTLVGSSLDGPLVCFACCKNIREGNNLNYCQKCNAAILCTSKCTGILHGAEECESFKTLNLNGLIFKENHQIIFPLRCLILRRCKPEVWNNFLKLEAHLEQRKDTPIWRRHQITVERYLKKCNVLPEEDLNGEMVQKVCGILDVNSFEVRPPHAQSLSVISPEVECLRGLYMEAALMAHDCVGNTFLAVDDTFNLTVTASMDIRKDQPIFFNYANVLVGSIDRKMHLKEGKYFECICARCEDPTELGTDISSLKCHRCRTGIIRMKHTRQELSPWICSNCEREFSAYLMKTTVEEGRRKLQDTDQSDVAQAEKLLKTLTKTFCDSHFLVLELKQNLIGVYSRQSPYKKHLERKIELCIDIANVISVVEPGISRIKALTLYQMQSAMIDLAYKEHQDRNINIETLLVKLLDAESKLKEAIKYLLYEPTHSPEGKIAQMALSELKMLRESIRKINIEAEIKTKPDVNGVDKDKKEIENMKELPKQDVKKKRSKRRK